MEHSFQKTASLLLKMASAITVWTLVQNLVLTKAVHDFIKYNDNFAIDRSKEDFLLTWNSLRIFKRR